MADTATIASLATAAGTLVLAIATFSSTRSANQAARVSERALQAGLRPVLFNARKQDPAQRVGFGDDHWVTLRDGRAAVEDGGENIYLAIPLRNVATGLAVLHSWRLGVGRGDPDAGHPDESEFRRLTRDIYVPAGDVGFWQGALRDPAEPLFTDVREAVRSRTLLTLDILYGDHDGGQHTITRFSLIPPETSQPSGDPVPEYEWLCSVTRHWNLDRLDPR
jgi:hypothetical protein